MTKHRTGTREEWLAARLELLKQEKELTLRSDELARRRQELPGVRIDKKYRFDQRERGIEYNYRREAAWQRREGSENGEEGAAVFAAMSGTDVASYTRERPGKSAFALENGVVYHAYSTYARGLDGLWGMRSEERRVGKECRSRWS